MTDNNIPTLITPHELTLEFHRIYGQPIRTEPVYAIAELRMRAELIREEAEELEEGLQKESIIDVADALGDLVYVCYGAAHTHGLLLDLSFNIEDGGTPAKPLLKSFIAENLSPSPRPSIHHEDAYKVVSSLRNIAEDYNKYVHETGLDDGDVEIINNYLVLLVSGSYYASFIFGIPLDAVLQEIQKSNMSKLGEDGKPIYREDGKVLKGPNFFVPEKNIAAVLLNAGAELTSEQDLAIIAEEEELPSEPAEEVQETRDLFSSEVVEEPAETFTAEELSGATDSIETIEGETEGGSTKEQTSSESPSETDVEQGITPEEVIVVEEEFVAESEESENLTEYEEDREDEAFSEEAVSVESEEANPVGEEYNEVVAENLEDSREAEADSDDKAEAKETESQNANRFEDSEPDFDSLFRKN